MDKRAAQTTLEYLKDDAIRGIGIVQEFPDSVPDDPECFLISDVFVLQMKGLH